MSSWTLRGVRRRDVGFNMHTKWRSFMKKYERGQGVGLQGLRHWEDDLFDFRKPMMQERKTEKSLQRDAENRRYYTAKWAFLCPRTHKGKKFAST